MFTLKTQGVFERFQREHYIPRPSVRWWRFRNVQGDGCTFIPVWGRWGDGTGRPYVSSGFDKQKSVC